LLFKSALVFLFLEGLLVMQTATAVHPFHMAFPVDDLQQAREFYEGLLGCSEGRSSDEWIDFNFYGHQIVAHLAQGQAGHGAESSVDSHDVPVRHFGVVLSMPEWQGLADRLTQAKVKFIIEPYIRFKGEVGEQATMFFLDPSGNAIEFKAMAQPDRLFAK
jgi:uncharacterized protein